MKNFYYRFINAVKLGYLGFKNPTVIMPNQLKMLCDLNVLILKVATEDRHLMTHIAYIHPEEGEKQIVSIWAGAGAGADPVKRISELVEEVNILKNQLANTLNKHQNG